MGVGALIDTERKGCESIIHDHDCDLWVTMVGWVYVPYSDWGDFRRRRAVDISSSNYFSHISAYWSVNKSQESTHVKSSHANGYSAAQGTLQAFSA